MKRIAKFILPLFFVTIFLGGCASKNKKQFEAILLYAENDTMVVYGDNTNDGNSLSGLAYLNLKDVKIKDTTTNESMSALEIPLATQITVFYEDELLASIYPPTYQKIKKIMVSAEQDNELYETGMQALDELQSPPSMEDS